MGKANIKISSAQLEAVKKATGQQTGQKAIEAALEYFLRHSRQRGITRVLEDISFRPGFSPLRERGHDR